MLLCLNAKSLPCFLASFKGFDVLWLVALDLYLRALSPFGVVRWREGVLNSFIGAFGLLAFYSCISTICLFK